MSGKRMIHASLFCNEELSDLPVEARYLFIATVVHADDFGRMRADAKYLKLKAFPFDSHRAEDVLTWRNQLSTKTNLIIVYAVDGKDYLYHPNWLKWQILRKDRLKSTDCPDPCQPTTNQKTTIGLPVTAEGSKEVKVRKLREDKRSEVKEVKEVKQSPSFASLEQPSEQQHVNTCTCEICWSKRPFPERSII